MKLKVGTRGSELALAQTKIVCDMLKSIDDNIEIEVSVIKTKGDAILDVSLDKIGDKGLFVKEIEKKLIDGDIDFAVHSLKDMPSELDSRLMITDVPLRASEKDVLIVNPKYNLENDEVIQWFKESSNLKIGTGSKRRFYQLRKINDSIIQKDIRGNIKTRINKLVDKDMDAIVLAKAGIDRLDIDDLVYAELDLDMMVPAVGQGCLAIEIRSDDSDMKSLIDSISDRYSTYQYECERAYLKKIGAGCHSPVGAFSYMKEDRFYIVGIFGDEKGDILVRKEKSIAWDKKNIDKKDINREVINKKDVDREALRNLGSDLAEEIMKEVNNLLY